MNDKATTPPQRLGIYVLQRAIGREATSLARIRHPNLVHIYAVGEDGNRHFIAMEYLKGHTVAEILRQRGALPLPVAARILGQVLAALDKVHAAGIVHRDLKPANVMIDEDQRAILMDFGLAKPRHDHSVATGNALIGTPEYMAPEVAEGQDADFRSDIYALGVILFELLTGRVPFHGNTAIATLRQQVEQPTPSPRSLTPTLPPQLDAVIARAMAKKPDERYPSVRAFAADLAALAPTPELTALAAALLPVLALLVVPRLFRRKPAVAAPKPSAAVYVVHSRHREAVTGRLLTIGGAGGLVSVKAEAGVVEIPYSDVLKLEPVVGR